MLARTLPNELPELEVVRVLVWLLHRLLRSLEPLHLAPAQGLGEL